MQRRLAMPQRYLLIGYARTLDPAATRMGSAPTLWIMFGIVAVSGTVLFTHAIRQNPDLPTTAQSMIQTEPDGSGSVDPSRNIAPGKPSSAPPTLPGL